MRIPSRVLLSLILGVTLAGGEDAQAATDWFASVYTGEGTELRTDQRVFTLFALLNAMGYDEGRVIRRDPIPKREFHPVRRLVRERLVALPAGVRTEAEAFFDSHPQPLRDYLRWALQSEGLEAGTAKAASPEVKGLDGLLRSVHTQAAIAPLLRELQPEHRRALRLYQSQLDAPLTRLRTLLRRPEGPTVLVLNLLDAHDAAWGAEVGKEMVLVVGPAGGTDGEPALRAFADAHLAPLVSARAEKGWGSGGALLREARARGAQEATVGEYATALLSRAVSLRAIGASDAAYETASNQGYFGLKDLGRMFDDARPVEAWAMDALARVEARRPPGKR